MNRLAPVRRRATKPRGGGTTWRWQRTSGSRFIATTRAGRRGKAPRQKELTPRGMTISLGIECRRAGLPANASVLELGFGNGEFLDWCRMARHRVCGVELIPELVERARAK